MICNLGDPMSLRHPVRSVGNGAGLSLKFRLPIFSGFVVKETSELVSAPFIARALLEKRCQSAL